MPRALLLMLSGSLTLLSPAGLWAQEDGLSAKGKVQIPQHKVSLKAGEIYVVKITSNGFQPNASIAPGFLRPVFVPFDAARPATTVRKFEAVFVAERTGEHVLSIVPVIFGTPPQGPLEYEAKVKRLALGKPILSKKEELTAADAKLNQQFRKGHHKAYPIAMKAGRTYVIEMTRQNDKGFSRMDPYLLLENPAGKVVAQDDDGAGQLNARMIYEATEAGDHRVIATTLGANQTGGFTITVRESAQE